MYVNANRNGLHESINPTVCHMNKLLLTHRLSDMSPTDQYTSFEEIDQV